MADNETPELIAEYKETARLIKESTAQVATKIYGQDTVLKQAMACVVAGRHGLFMGPPGTAKTKLVNSIGEVLGITTNRIQCTPDMMPADIIGSEVPERDDAGNLTGKFTFVPGPIFTNLLLVDEINRTSPKTQSALLQAMEEGFVTYNGKNYVLPRPFIVLATQNPIEQEGTYPLPEAQLDRFMFRINMDFPGREAALKITAGAKAYRAPRISDEFKNSGEMLTPLMNAEKLLRTQKLIDFMPLNEGVTEYITDMVMNGLPHLPQASDVVKQFVSWPPGPRALENLALASEALALVDGRTAPSKSDVDSVAPWVLEHRMHTNHKFKGQPFSKILDAMRPQ